MVVHTVVVSFVVRVLPVLGSSSRMWRCHDLPLERDHPLPLAAWRCRNCFCCELCRSGVVSVAGQVGGPWSALGKDGGCKRRGWGRWAR